MTWATIFYLPPPDSTKCGPSACAFVDNLNRCKPAGRTVVFSDFAGWKERLKFKPSFHVLGVPPDRLEQAKVNPHSGISNCLFAQAMRIAREEKIVHALYLESDCRVNEGFDEIVFDEFFGLKRNLICAGSLVSWNAPNGGLEYTRRVCELISLYRKAPLPVTSFGMFPLHGKPCNPSLFPNGAGAVYNVPWMHQFFGEFKNMMNFATGEGMEGKAFDYQIGEKIRQNFRLQAFDLVAHLTSVCSTYGEHLTTADQRLELLRSKAVAIAHQFKGKETL